LAKYDISSEIFTRAIQNCNQKNWKNWRMEDIHLEDWKEIKMSQPREEIQKRKQTSIEDWTGKRARIEEDITEDDNIPEVRKVVNVIPKATRKRQTGKLTKKEQKRMKATLLGFTLVQTFIDRVCPAFPLPIRF
jgi:hypothetical protein